MFTLKPFSKQISEDARYFFWQENAIKYNETLLLPSKIIVLQF